MCWNNLLQRKKNCENAKFNIYIYIYTKTPQIKDFAHKGQQMVGTLSVMEQNETCAGCQVC